MEISNILSVNLQFSEGSLNTEDISVGLWSAGSPGLVCLVARLLHQPGPPLLSHLGPVTSQLLQAS